MEAKRIICIGTVGNKVDGKAVDHLTMGPSMGGADNGRYYRYPKPGKVHVWGGDATTFELKELKGHELAAAYPNGPVIQGYGMLIIGDTYAQLLKPSLDSPDFAVPHTREFETKIYSSLERSRALLEFWENYGVLVIAGDLPTPEELVIARASRERYAKNRINQEVSMRREGGLRMPYTETDRAWAFEYGKMLPETVDSLVHAAVEDFPCPECMLLIHRQARRCRHCHGSFGMPVTEYIEERLTRPAVA